MKRLILTTTGTVAGVAALLSFKTQTAPLASTSSLPSAAVSSGGTAASTAGTGSTGSGPSTGAASGSTSGPASGPSSTSAVGSTPKTYKGTAITTRYGIVQVKATIANGRITDVAFVQLSAFDGRSQQINSDAGPELLQETLTQQTAKVDTVSGASYTSEGYRESLQSALDQAGLK